MKCPDCGEIVFKHQELCPNCHCPLLGPKEETADAENQQADSPRHVEAIPVAAPAEKQPKKKHYGLLGVVVVFVILLVAALLGIYFYKEQMRKKEIAEFQNAIVSNEPDVLQRYLSLYQDAPADHRDAVMEKLDEWKRLEREWENAAASGSKSELQEYLKNNPDSRHKSEAIAKIDSIDWEMAQAENNQDSYEGYMTEHQQGEHYDEARALLEKLIQKMVSQDDKDMIKQLFKKYFNGLAAKDETGIISTITNVLSIFLNKANATPADVISHMKKLYESGDITDMKFSLRDDWDIDKVEEPDGTYSFKVKFSVDQQIVRTDPDKEKGATYKVSAKVSPSGKISELKMTKVVEE